jgi:hypothetical protein
MWSLAKLECAGLEGQHPWKGHASEGLSAGVHHPGSCQVTESAHQGWQQAGQARLAPDTRGGVCVLWAPFACSSARVKLVLGQLFHSLDGYDMNSLHGRVPVPCLLQPLVLRASREHLPALHCSMENLVHDQHTTLLYRCNTRPHMAVGQHIHASMAQPLYATLYCTGCAPHCGTQYIPPMAV